MKFFKHLILFTCFVFGTAAFLHAEDAAPAPEIPAGFDSFFPKGYTKPKVVGPTPTFEEKKVDGSKTGVQNAHANSNSSSNTDDDDANSVTGVKLQDGNTDLMIAATKGDFETVKNLVKKGRNVNVRNKFGSTALMGASAGGFNEIVQLLLEHGASVTAKSKGGMTALTFAQKNGHDDTAKLIQDSEKKGGSKSAK
jgi:ankyrin repeat protein